MVEPLLSIGIIFKNDIRCLERCLQSLEPLRKAIPCQLVMGDTGSTDGSRAVAERYADILIDFPWINDFAAARNAVLEHCTGKWYLTVDSDEWLAEDFSQLVKFLHSPEANQADGARIIQRNFGNRDLVDYSDFYATRMGRMRNGKLRYVEPIHEYLAYIDRSDFQVVALPKVILNHDGYLEVTPGAVAAKHKRNMILLQKELERTPDNLRTLRHCISSAESIPERRRLIERSLKVVAEQPLNSYSNEIYSTAAQFYWDDGDMETAKQHLDAWHQRIPDSTLYRVDGEYLQASVAYQQDRYQDALEHIRAYEEGIADVDSGADLLRPDRLSTMYFYASVSPRQQMQCTQFHCLCELGRFEEVDELLQDPALTMLPPRRKGFVVLKVLEFWEHLDRAAPFLRTVWDRAFADLAAAQAGKEYDACRNWADHLTGMFQKEYEKKGETVLTRFAEMGSRVPGCCARILLSEDSRQIAGEWEQVKDFGRIFPQVYLHCMELGVPLPEAFYQQTREELAAAAAAMVGATGLRMARTVARWLAEQSLPETLGDLVWRLEVVTAALRVLDESADPVLGEILCGMFVTLSGLYNGNVYAADVLVPEEVRYLPPMHRCGWYCGQAMECLEQGDELGYVRALRAALDAAPAMKNMVDFLLEHKPKTTAQRQLEELAEQVRAILAQYAPDDPAVAALKQSEAYQRVAPLLEQQGMSGAQPQTSEVPVSPVLLEEALTGSREEIASSVRQNIRRWGQALAARRAGYWERYPLWGKDKDEVVDNLSAALSSHSADFRWLFDRLGDEQSRRVLTAVVRSWRFYEVEPLDQVKDERYDDYFDLSLLHCDENEVVADLGAYTGDTFLSYVKNYGSLAYRRYYCYEITKDSFDTLRKVTAPYPRVVLRRKGAGDGPGVMALEAGADASANILTSGGSAAETVEVVALDEDITEPLTLIKMDIEGAEQSALRGCARHIREARPKLALSVYHNFEDLWKLPRMIDELAPGYRFFLRYHGGNLWPSEITLLGLPQ